MSAAASSNAPMPDVVSGTSCGASYDQQRVAPFQAKERDADCPFPQKRLILHHPDDRNHLTEFVCVVRRQIEVFVETPWKNVNRGADHQNPYAKGKVGIRCVFCAAPPDSESAVRTDPPMRGSVLYPTSTRLMHQSVRNYQRFHMLKCPFMPEEVRDNIAALKSGTHRSSKHSGAYWEMSCVRMGLVDTEEGLRLRNAALDGTWTDEMGREAMEGVRSQAKKAAAAAAAARSKMPKGKKEAKTNSASVETSLIGEAAVTIMSTKVASEGRRPQSPKERRVGNEDSSALEALCAKPAENSLASATNVGASVDKKRNELDSSAFLGADAGIFSEDFNPLLSPLGHDEALSCEDVFDDPDTLFALGADAAVAQAEHPRSEDAELSVSPQLMALPLQQMGVSVAEECYDTSDSQLPHVQLTQNRASQSDSDALGRSSPLLLLDKNVSQQDPSFGPSDLSSFLELGTTAPMSPASKGTIAVQAASPQASDGPCSELIFMQPTIRHNYSTDIISHQNRTASVGTEGSTPHSSWLGSKAQQSVPSPGVVETCNDGSVKCNDLGATVGLDDLSAAQGLPTMEESSFEPCMARNDMNSVRAEVLTRVELACTLVQATSEIQPLPSGAKAPAASSDDLCVDADDLYALGVELYETFAHGQSRTPGREGHGDSERTTMENVPCEWDMFDENHVVGQATKRGRPLERASGQSVVPLSELGLPSELCFLVSSLLEAKSIGAKAGCGYASFEEVQEDLRLMADHPEKYLFNSTSLIGGSALQLPGTDQTLYGRDEEVSKLLDAFQRTVSPSRTDDKSTMVLISGYSGTGKTSIVRNVQGRLVEMGACFISGKFDAMCQMEPLSAIMGALNEYCHALAQDVNRIDEVREAVSAAMGDEGRVLAPLIPNLTEIMPHLTEQTAPSEAVWVPEAQQRLAYLVRTLIQTTCSREHPVVLFLDDLQWADSWSLELMRTLIAESKLDALMLIGSYRDNEVGQGHMLLECFDSIQRIGGTTISQVDTKNLDIESVNALVSDALHMIPRTTRSLAEVVLQKTGGNALFAKQFLTTLNDEGLLRYSLVSRRWEWDIDVLKAKNIANNVVELMTAKLLRLAPEVHNALRIASSFGLQCHEDVLRALDLDARRMGRTSEALDVAVAEGLMAKVEGPAYRFSHDQIQSAAYMLIPEAERELFHLEIGRSLWRHSSVKERDTNLFIVVDQQHRGSSCISNHDDKINLAQLSLMAAQKAATMSAFLPASVYCESGIGLLREVDWIVNRDLCFNLFNLCAEMEFVLGKFSKVNALSEEVIERGKTLNEKIHAYYTLVQSSGSQGNVMDAFAMAVTVLGHLGECLPSCVSPPQIQHEITNTQSLLGKRQGDELFELEQMTDIHKRQAMRFFNLIIFYALVHRREYFPLIACRMVQISLSYGVCKESSIAYTAYGMVICGLAGDTAGGYRMGKIALNLVERFKAKEYLARVILGVHGYINDWTEPLQSSVTPLKEAIGVGLSTGDPEYAMLNAQFYHGACLASGRALSPLIAEMNEYAKQALELNQTLAYSVNQPLRQFTLNLLGRSSDPVKLVGEVMDEEALLHVAEEDDAPMLRSIILFYRMWLEYLFGKYECAAETSTQNKNVQKDGAGRFAIVCNHAFYHGLTALALARKQGHSKWTDTINSTMTQMRVWTVSAPWNCLHKLELLNAEYAYLEGNMDAAAKHYDQAVSTAAEHRFVHEKALSLERAGIFYSETGNHTTASDFFRRARDCYALWEAHSKVAHVKLYL